MQMLDDDDETVLKVALGNQGPFLFREYHNGVSTLIKEKQISDRDKSISNENVWGSGNIG